MPKNTHLFLEKRCKIVKVFIYWPVAAGTLRTVTSAYWYSFVECVSSIKRILLLRKITEVTNSICSVLLFPRLFFPSNSAAFVGRGAFYRAQGTCSYAGGVASGSKCPGAQVFIGAHQHTFCSYSKTRFKQKFRPK